MVRAGGFKAGRSKYNNRITVMHGLKFHSAKEAKRYDVLLLRQLAGEVQDIRLQVPYKLTVNGMLICKYIADFVYMENGAEVVEDSKGYRTPEYILKAKLMRACYGIEIKET